MNDTATVNSSRLMRVAFIGNVNNHPFIVCKHLKDKGVDTLFFVEATRQNKLYRPESTGLVNYPYPDWIKEVPQFQHAHVMHLPHIFAKNIIDQINKCDAVILNDFAHRLIPHLRKSIIKICMFTGGDLEIMGDFDNVEQMKISSTKLKMLPQFIKKVYARYSVKQLRSAIKKSNLVGYFPAGLNSEGDKILNEIFEGKPFAKYSHWCMMLDGFNYTPPKKNKKVRVLNLARFIWQLPLPPGTTALENKRNDIMIDGIGLFLKANPGTLDVHFIDKGIHVEATKALIEKNNFTDAVTWHDEMPLSELSVEIEKADILFDQLGAHLIGAGVISMAKGRPLIANARPEILQQVSTGPIPVCHATNPQEVFEWLQKLVFDEDLRIKTGILSSKFAFEFMDIRSESEYYFNFIKNKLAE